jgi:hypothetical protein
MPSGDEINQLQTRAASAAWRLSKSCTNVIRPSEMVNTENEGRLGFHLTPEKDVAGRCSDLIEGDVDVRLHPRPEQFEDILSALARPGWIDREPANIVRVEFGQTLEVAPIVCVHRASHDKECA